MNPCSFTVDAAAHHMTLHGSLVASAVPEVREALRAMVVDGASITIDCADVDLIDSMGIGLLISTFNTLHSVHAALILTSVSPKLRELLHLLRLDQRFTMPEPEHA